MNDYFRGLYDGETMSTVFESKLHQVFLYKNIPEHINFQAEELSFCDCFIERSVMLMESLSNLSGERNIKDFMLQCVMGSPISNFKTLILLGKISIVCCEVAPFYFDYMERVSKEEMHKNCYIDLAFTSLKNCSFYLEGSINSKTFCASCWSCKVYFLTFVFDRFFKISKDDFAIKHQ